MAVTTTLENPNDPLYLATDPFYSGVARLTITTPTGGYSTCSGALLTGGLTLLTAAHCVASSGTFTPGTNVEADFGALGVYNSLNILVFPSYNASTNVGDLALVYFSSPIAGAQTYSLYRNTDEAGQVADIAGYGRYGSGTTGSVNAGNGVLRHGDNLVDYVASSNGNPATGDSATFLAFDFDNGTADQNAFALVSASYSNTGQGNSEVGAARGDSGGPTFLNQQIAGIISYGACFGVSGNCFTPPDINTTLDSSFGEVFFATRVSSYADWIDQELVVPEPAAFALTGLGLALLASRRRKKY